MGKILRIVGFPGSSLVKNLPIQDIWAQSLSRDDPLEEEKATHSSILAEIIPQTEEPGGLQSMRVAKRLIN